MARYRMTPKRRIALKKAQIASARKRKGTGRGKKIAAGVAIGAGVVAVGVGTAYVKKTASGGPQRRSKDYKPKELRSGLGVPREEYLKAAQKRASKSYSKSNRTANANRPKATATKGPRIAAKRRNPLRKQPPGQAMKAIPQNATRKPTNPRRVAAVKKRRAAAKGTNMGSGTGDYGRRFIVGTGRRPTLQSGNVLDQRLGLPTYGTRNPNRKKKR